MLKFKAFFAITFAFIFVQTSVLAQVYDPVKWKFDVKEISDTEAEIIFSATIEDGWHIYANELESDMGPLPTEFLFNESADYKTVGKIKQGKFKTEYDKNFQMDLDYFEGRPVFKQRIKRISNIDFKVTGELSYMVCDDEKCLPPEYIPFDLAVKGAVGNQSPNKPLENLGGSSLSSSLNQAPQLEGESQIYDPIKWEFSVEDETDSTAVLVAEATLEENWHLYSMFVDENAGPVPTSLNFEESNSFEVIGKPSEGKPEIIYDPNFQIDLGLFSGTAKFKQKIRKLTTKPAKITGQITFMVCDDMKCLPPDDLDFAFAIEAGSANIESAKADVETIGEKKESKRSNWGIFIIAFLSGFAALLTPCVFPMIPMTVSFFTKQSKTRAAGIKNAIIYGLSIVVIYVLLGAVVTWAFGASVLSEMATNPWFNLAFFVLLIVFAISFLGAFEITLPSSWINKADSKADKGGLIGIFFMAFVLALVSFSCTGPIVGSLLVEAASRGGTAPVIGMLGFSLAIALPFALFAAFPGWLNSLPQSGGWLNSVKVVLGFLELALAFKFLSNADLVMDFHFLEREVFLAIWIVIFGMLTLYLLGKLKLPHDSDLKYISVPRVLMALVTGMFTVYMIPGLWGAPLKLISAFPPPMQYSESPMGVGFTGGTSAINAPENEDQHLGPQNIYVFHDYNKGLAFAKEKNLPLMLDFTGKACVNCRKMEEQVWSDPEIKRKLDQELVLVSLYVDLREELPKSEQITVDLGNGREKKLRYVGDKWAAMQEIKYKINAQPYYVLLDHNEEMLIEPANYQDYGEVDLFSDWLDRGIKKFKKK
ncbi:thiol:disulfide interchange protein [Cryomorpha ignava]|uniref:Thiol:disulfide interchange protein n=1 Tax=Cryomorpha ignava TaxID=101383 RepID=A0A7K3WN49_9FLAO|nr:thioredoxin family protein [Cryomorpha ignava]NEN23077.1 thiol:disulfide interchange protein [Cryomorpha ignava]